MTHKQAYIICATPRSGTTLLCDLLTDTGVAGCPDSFFRLETLRWWADYLAVPVAGWTGEHDFDQAFLRAVLREGSAAGEVFGMRLMWELVGFLSTRLDRLYPGLSSDSARLRTAFGPISYVYLSREDKLAQAISRIKAEQSGLWHIDADSSERERLKPAQAPVYDAHRLAQQVAEYERDAVAWESWFAQQQIEPRRITYEELSSQPRATLAAVLSAIGLDPLIAGTVKPRTAKLADRESEEWAARFRTQTAHHPSSTS